MHVERAASKKLVSKLAYMDASTVNLPRLARAEMGRERGESLADQLRDGGSNQYDLRVTEPHRNPKSSNHFMRRSAGEGRKRKGSLYSS